MKDKAEPEVSKDEAWPSSDRISRGSLTLRLSSGEIAFDLSELLEELGGVISASVEPGLLISSPLLVFDRERERDEEDADGGGAGEKQAD